MIVPRVLPRRPAALLASCLLAAGAAPPARAAGDATASLRAWPTIEERLPDDAAAVAWERAGEYLGRHVTVRGKVVRTHRGEKAVHLNFREAWQGTFQVVIFARAWCEWPEPPEQLFRGREVLVSGVVREYRGAPEIVVESPAQIRFGDGSDPAATAAPGEGPRARAEQAGRPPGVRVATWNLQNFFDGWDDPYREDERTVPPSIAAGRRQRIADALHGLDADVVCLQEVENRFALEELLRAYLPRAGYEVALVEGNDPRGIDVAVLSRLPIESVTSYRHLRFADDAGGERRFSRDLLRVRIGGALRADVFCLHLRSRSGGPEADRVRVAEARAASAIVRAELRRDPSWRGLVAGDFNDEIGRPALDAFLEGGTAAGAGLTDLCSGSEAPTYHRPPHVSRIDFLLASPALAADEVEASVVRELPDVRLECASDHYPVAARFAAGPVRPARP